MQPDRKLTRRATIEMNYLCEPGTRNFHNPQSSRGAIGRATALADLHLPVQVGGDHALFLGLATLLLEWEVVDEDLVSDQTVGSDSWAATCAAATGTRSPS